MSKYVKNNSGSTDTWLGHQLDNLETFEIPHSSHERWIADANESGSKLETDINSGALQVSKNGTTWMAVADGLEWMKSVEADVLKNKFVMAEPTDGQLAIYDDASGKWECKGLTDMDGAYSKIDFHIAGSSGGKWMFAPYGDTLGQASDVTPYVLPFDFQVTSLLFTNKKGDADPIIKIHKNMDLVTVSHTWTLPINSIWAVKNSGLSSWTFNQFDKLSVWVESGGNNPDDIYFELNGYFMNKNTTDSSGSTF